MLALAVKTLMQVFILVQVSILKVDLISEIFCKGIQTVGYMNNLH
jgi:hypothetical protein